jgi:Flp pilus assembly protein TadG
MVTQRLRVRRGRGAAAVELALALPILVMLLLGIMEFGYAFFIQSSVAGAARVGVRNYAINWTQPNADLAAIALAKTDVPDPTAVASASFQSPCTLAGAQTTMVLTYQYHSLTGMFDWILGSNVQVSGKASMACGG